MHQESGAFFSYSAHKEDAWGDSWNPNQDTFQSRFTWKTSFATGASSFSLNYIVKRLFSNKAFRRPECIRAMHANIQVLASMVWLTVCFVVSGFTVRVSTDITVIGPFVNDRMEYWDIVTTGVLQTVRLFYVANRLITVVPIFMLEMLFRPTRDEYPRSNSEPGTAAQNWWAWHQAKMGIFSTTRSWAKSRVLNAFHDVLWCLDTEGHTDLKFTLFST